MKRLLWLGTIVLFASVATAKAEDAAATKTDDQKEPKKEETTPKGEADLLAKVSYIIGMNIGSQFKQDGVEANVGEIAKGIKDGLSGAKSALTEEQMKDAMQEFQKMMVAK